MDNVPKDTVASLNAAAEAIANVLEPVLIDRVLVPTEQATTGVPIAFPEFEWRFRVWSRVATRVGGVAFKDRVILNKALSNPDLLNALHKQLQPQMDLSDFFKWFTDHWELILSIILRLLPLFFH